jgi:uncharacterized integral membrane protein
MRVRWMSLVFGVILVLLGAVWILQGAGVLGGSFMSGHAQWAVIGAILAVAGAGLAVIGFRGSPKPAD